MKIKSVNRLYYQSEFNQYYRQKPNTTDVQLSETGKSELPCNFYYPVNINFTAANSKHIKTLFSYGLPCIYTGIEMIDPAAVQNMLGHNIHKLPIGELCKYIDTYAKSLLYNEKEVYQVIKNQAAIEPNKNIRETFQQLKQQYEHELVEKQAPIFTTLRAYAYALPDDLKLQVDLLLADSISKIKNEPIVSRFSVTEFKYKIEKIKSDISKLHDKKKLGVINHIIKLSNDFDAKTTDKNINKQRKVLSNIEHYINRFPIKENLSLNDLITSSIAQIEDEKVVIPFSRKSFIYELGQILNNTDNPRLIPIFMKIANKLPTSQSSIAAYITKYSKESSEKIFYRLLWPSFATIEHICPKSCGGVDLMENYAGACARENSDRSSIPFVEQIKRRPDTAKYCQKYVNRLIKYAKQGIFEKEGINVSYIEDFKNTIEKESKGQIILDTSALYQGGRFQKQEPAPKVINLVSV